MVHSPHRKCGKAQVLETEPHTLDHTGSWLLWLSKTINDLLLWVCRVEAPLDVGRCLEVMADVIILLVHPNFGPFAEDIWLYFQGFSDSDKNIFSFGLRRTKLANISRIIDAWTVLLFMRRWIWYNPDTLSDGVRNLKGKKRLWERKDSKDTAHWGRIALP